GIVHELSPPMTLQCNGIAERGNRTIIETIRTMLADSKLSLRFWGEAANAAAYTRNRIKSRVHGKTPYEVWHQRKPNVQHMKRFGCMAYVLSKGGTRKKFDSKIKRGFFVGYNENKTYRVYIPETNSIKCDCDVRFDGRKKWLGSIKL
ncbi:Copia protein, partial [Habropoda laboriosa]